MSNGNELANPPAVTEQSAMDEATVTVGTVIDEAAQAGEQAAHVDGFEHETETAQGMLEVGLNAATQRMTDQVTQVLSLDGSEAEEQTHRASQNLQAVTQASTVLARGFQEASNEVFRSAQNRLTKNMDGLNRMAGCRSVRAVVAAQSELMRDNLQLTIDTNRRIAELSVRIADEATGAIRVTEKG
jgi:hypothetical protein